MSAADQIDLFLDVLLALGLGAAVGLERELRDRRAGIRTIGLVCMGAAVFALVSETFTEDSRVAAGVVQGIGFIGAGIVFQRGRDVVGLTTAATVWVMAGVGLLVGRELRLLAVLVSISTIVALETSHWYDYFADRRALRGSLRAGRRAPHPDADRSHGPRAGPR